MNKNSKIFVAGHNGLVGSAIMRGLISEGFTNIITRDRSELDLTIQADVARFFNDEKPEYVFLAAAKVGGIIANNQYRADFIYKNIIIQSNVIHHAYLNGVKKLLFLGSTCIYPREAPQPLSEELLLTSPLEYTNEPYAMAKIAGMKMCESYNIQYGTNFISVMPTNLYGPHDNFDLASSHVIPALIRKLHLAKMLTSDDMEAISDDFAKLPIEGVDGSSKKDMIDKMAQFGIVRLPNGTVEVEILGSGRVLREFLWSEDLANACLYVMKNVNWEDLTKDKKELRNCHLNIGSGREVSISNLAEIIAAEVGFRGLLRFNPDKPEGVMRKLTDLTKIHSLGWKHSIELTEGIEKLYKWYLVKNERTL